MKNFTRLANIITETPPRLGREEAPSERQQGDSKRIKQVANKNYYDAFNAMFNKNKPEDREEGIGTVDAPPRKSNLTNETTPRLAETSTKSEKEEE